MKSAIFKKIICIFYRNLEKMILAVAMATEEAKYILTAFFLVLSGTDHCVKVSSISETMRAGPPC